MTPDSSSSVFHCTQVKDCHSAETYHFYVENEELNKCSWLKGMKSAPAPDKQNMVALNSPAGVCYKAVTDIAAGEELLVLFDKSYGSE